MSIELQEDLLLLDKFKFALLECNRYEDTYSPFGHLRTRGAKYYRDQINRLEWKIINFDYNT